MLACFALPRSPELFNIVVLQELRGKINGHGGRVAVVRRAQDRVGLSPSVLRAFYSSLF